MTSKEYIIWLKGFAAAAGEYTLTPHQWDDLKDELNKVDDTPYISDDFTIGPNGAYERDPNQFPFGVPNGTRGPETPTGTGIRVTTTPGTNYITVANPYIASFGTVTTSTATSLPSGSTISYTISNDKTLLND
jgi:hypothetical protein